MLKESSSFEASSGMKQARCEAGEMLFLAIAKHDEDGFLFRSSWSSDDERLGEFQRFVTYKLWSMDGQDGICSRITSALGIFFVKKVDRWIYVVAIDEEYPEILPPFILDELSNEFVQTKKIRLRPRKKRNLQAALTPSIGEKYKKVNDQDSPASRLLEAIRNMYRQQQEQQQKEYEERMNRINDSVESLREFYETILMQQLKNIDDATSLADKAAAASEMAQVFKKNAKMLKRDLTWEDETRPLLIAAGAAALGGALFPLVATTSGACALVAGSHACSHTMTMGMMISETLGYSVVAAGGALAGGTSVILVWKLVKSGYWLQDFIPI